MNNAAPAKYELIIMKTAEALGVLPTLQARADELFE